MRPFEYQMKTFNYVLIGFYFATVNYIKPDIAIIQSLYTPPATFDRIEVAEHTKAHVRR